MDLLESILSRYPSLTERDVALRDDGEGVYVDYWNSLEPKPTPEQLTSWNEEDMATYIPPKSMEEQLEEEKAKTRRLETQLNQTNADLQGFMDYFFATQPQ